MAAQDYQQITLDRSQAIEGVATITLNRPEKLNAWTRTMQGELGDAIERCNQDDSVGAIVVTGAGRGFCAGADIKATFKTQLDGATENNVSDTHEASRDWVGYVRRSKPIIGAINGVAVGVGITQVLPFDILLASERAKVGMLFVKMGLVPELASSHLLVQRVGFALASEMCLTGRLYEAHELDGTGFFNEVVAHEDLLPRAFKLAREIAANPSSSLRWVKQLLTENGSETNLNLVQERELALLQEAYKSPNFEEAVQAFLEKRAPIFT